MDKENDKKVIEGAVLFSQEGLQEYVSALTYVTKLQTALYVFRSLESIEDDKNRHDYLDRQSKGIEAELKSFQTSLPDDSAKGASGK